LGEKGAGLVVVYENMFYNCNTTSSDALGMGFNLSIYGYSRRWEIQIKDEQVTQGTGNKAMVQIQRRYVPGRRNN